MNLKINGNLAKLIEHSDSEPECLDEIDEGFSRSLRILYGELFKNANNENCEYLSLIEHCEAVITRFKISPGNLIFKLEKNGFFL